MTVLVWDDTGKRLYEQGVDHGVLYPLNTATSAYDLGVAWNGLTTVTETPAGAEANPAYADNIKYLNLISIETFGGTIEAFTYPNEFALCDGTVQPQPGVNVGQQPRKTFGLSYRTKIGNDVTAALGYKLHLMYGLLASPSEKAYATINDSPEALSFSWDVNSTPVPVTGMAPTSLIVVDSTKESPAMMQQLQDALYGTAGQDPRLPMPDAVIAMFAATLTVATPVVPTYVPATDIITIPAVTGLEYLIDGVVVPAGPFGPITVSKVVHARPLPGYKLPDISVDEWLITFS
jgi:hypothetical protein